MYQVLDRNLLPIGRLTLNPGNNATTFWADSIQKQIAQDNSNSDPASAMSMILHQGSSDANEKLFNHSLSVTFDNSNSVGAKVEAQSTYLMYQDEGNSRYYLMSVIQVDQENNYRTAQAQNTAIIELGKIFTTGKTFTQARLADILKYVFSFAPFSVSYPDDNQIVLDSYVIDVKDSVLKVLQDLQVKYNVDIDAYVELDINGRINNRVVSFENIGDNKGLILRYGSRNKGFENLVKTTVSDTLYTKFHITGVTKDGDTNAGSIKSVNNGKDYIVDDNANEKYNPIGASQNPPTYLEVYLENTVLSEPLALLSWGKQIMGLFNHPRDNYTVTAMHDTDVSLGDTVVVQDNSKKPAVVISARVIQMTSSFASPETNVIVLGEFTNLTSTKSDTGNTVLTQLKKDITTAQNSANEAINTAELAQQNADKANQAAQTASQKIDTTMATERTRVDGLLDQQNTKIQSVVKEASDYTDSAKSEVLNKAQSMADEAQDSAIAESNKVRDNLAQETADRTKEISDLDKKSSDAIDQAKDDVRDTINALSVGGRNLLLNTSSEWQHYKGWGMPSQIIDVTAYAGKSIIYGAFIKNVTAPYAGQGVAIAVSTTGLQKDAFPISGNWSTVTTETKLVGKYTVPSDGSVTQIMLVLGTNSESVEFDYKEQKAEWGSIPTDYTQAPEDIVYDYTNKDNQIKSSFTQYQQTNDGKVGKAQSDATQALGLIETKVSQTDFNNKTNDLGSKYSDVKQTVDGQTTDIADIKAKEGQQDSRMTSIENNANGTKVTVSDIQSKQGQQSADISTLQQRADGFERTVTKVNGLSVGGRNLLLGTSQFTGSQWNLNGTVSGSYLNMGVLTSTYVGYDASELFSSKKVNTTDKFTFSFYVKNTSTSDVDITFTSGATNNNGWKISKVKASQDWARVSISISWWTLSGGMGVAPSTGTLQFAGFKLEKGSLITDWAPAPEDVDSSISKAQQTADQASLNLSNYKTDADGRITKAQSDIVTNANDIKERVSLDTFNQKTGEINSRFSQVEKDTESVTTTVGDIKDHQGKQDDDIAQVKVTADSITNWVKDSNGNISSSMMTALFNTTALKDFDKNSSVKSQTANMISSAVSSSENGMRSLISQKADSTVIGTISDSLSDLQKSIQWEQIAYDDLNFLKGQGNYLITSGAGINSPIQPWFYITVDAPRGDRITQHIWKDLDASASYSRTFDGSNWSAWIQIANSSTLLSIFNDQWSLGTYINTSIGQKIASGISGLPDGTLALTGRSIHLTGDTIVDGSFMTKALSTQDATIGKTLTLGSGGSIDSKVLTMDDNSFNVLADNINSVYTSYDNWQVTTKGMFSIYSNLGTVQSSGSTHIVNNANGYAVDGNYFTQYSTNQVYMTSTASDQDSDFLQQTQMTSTMLVLASGKGTSIQNRPNTTVVRSTGITTSGYVNSGNLQLNGSHSIVSTDGGDINFTRPDGNAISIRAYWVTAGNIRLNGNHGIISQDGGKLYITNANGVASDLSVKSLSQTSLVSTKEHIGNVDPEYALSETLKADIRQYNFKGDPTDDIHTTPMIDDVEGKMYIPHDWLDYDKQSVDTYSIIGYLVQSVKALQAEIDTLKGK